MRFQDPVVQLAQNFGHISSNIVIVLDEEYRLGGMGVGDFRFGCLVLPDVSGHGREVDRDNRGLVRFSVDLDVAARLMDEAVNLTQAKASSLPGLLGREEWFEHPLQNVLRHSRAGVADGNPHVWSGDKSIMLLTVLLIKEGIFSRDRQLRACAHGATGVDGEIKYGRPQLDWIGYRLPQPVGSDDVESDR